MVGPEPARCLRTAALRAAVSAEAITLADPTWVSLAATGAIRMAAPEVDHIGRPLTRGLFDRAGRERIGLIWPELQQLMPVRGEQRIACRARGPSRNQAGRAPCQPTTPTAPTASMTTSRPDRSSPSGRAPARIQSTARPQHPPFEPPEVGAWRTRSGTPSWPPARTGDCRPP
jgi:hypothetical protein